MKDKSMAHGANEATVFEVNKDVTIDGKSLKAGKYGLFTLWNGDSWTIIFNKTWNQWGAFKYEDKQDAFARRCKKYAAFKTFRKMTFWVGKDGKVTLAWGNVGFDFVGKIVF